MIALIDYDAGNIRSVEKALTAIGKRSILTRDAHEILAADHVILPGVGSFGDAMANLRKYDLVNVIREVTAQGTPFLGICLGLQLLFESSEESPGVQGLGILKGRVVRFSEDYGLKIPHMGWNSLDICKKSVLFEGITENPYVYFVHSYYLKASNESDVAARAEYGAALDAAVEHGNVFACQFHPEKSSTTGLSILKNFVRTGGGH